MRVILASVGTIGDTLPFVGIGREFARRGHEVVLLGNGAYRAIVERAGLEFVELISAAESERQAVSRARWHRGLIALREGFANLLRDVPATYREIAERYVPGRTVVVAPGIMFGARMAQEKLGVPLATMHLQPACFRSERDLFRWSPRTPETLIRWAHRIGDGVVDSYLAKPLNRFRAEFGLPPAAKIMCDWWNSPNLTIGAFPKFLAPTRNVWPENFLFPGFPLYHADEAFEEEDRLREFLARNPRPVVFCPTSAVGDARAFLSQAAAAAQLDGRAAVILTPRLEQVPAELPANVAHFRFVPHHRLLPEASALMHNGGIGTAAAAMRAGIPQLIVPRMLDQPDNASRLQQLGVAAVLSPRACRPDRAARELKALLDSPQVAERCRHFAAECSRTNAIDTIADAVERLAV